MVQLAWCSKRYECAKVHNTSDITLKLRTKMKMLLVMPDDADCRWRPLVMSQWRHAELRHPSVIGNAGGPDTCPPAWLPRWWPSIAISCGVRQSVHVASDGRAARHATPVNNFQRPSVRGSRVTRRHNSNTAAATRALGHCSANLSLTSRHTFYLSSNSEVRTDGQKHLR